MRKIIVITLIAFTLSYNLRFLTGETDIEKQTKDAGEKINGFQKVENLCNAAEKIGKTWQNLITAFKTTHQKSIKKLTDGKGFDYFHGSSEIFLSFGLKQIHYEKYFLRKSEHLLIPKGMRKKFLEITDDAQFMDINQPEEGKFDIMITDIKAKFKLAPDLFIERTDTSVLGGIFQKGKEKIIKKPKNLTQEELTAILEMYKMVSFKVLCDVFGIKVSIPKFN